MTDEFCGPTGKADRDAEVLDEAFKTAGAIVMGRRMFDEGEGPWGDDPLVPVLLGDGIRLFDQMGPEDIELESTRVIDSPGVTHLRFRVVK